MSEENKETGEGQESAPSVEEQAKVLGWKPPDEFKGDPEFALSAEDFIEKGQRDGPILRENVRKLQATVADQGRIITQMKSDTSSYIDMTVKAQIADYEDDLKKAADEGDSEGVIKAHKAITDIKDSQKPTTEVNGKAPPPEVQAFLDANPWYNTDATKTAYADFIDKTEVGDTPAEHLANIAKKVKEKFMEKKPTPPNVEGGGRKKTASKGSKTYEGMDDEAKAICDRMVSNKYVTKEKFVENYHKGQANG